MVTIAIDTSQPVGSVSLGRGGEVLGTLKFGGASSHLLELGRCAKRLLGDNHLTMGQVERIAVVIGPGSFTGLRVGLAYVKGLKAGLDVDIVTINTLELLALPLLSGGNRVCPMIDARKKEVYAAVYQLGPSTGDRYPHSAVAVLSPRVQEPEKFLEEAAIFAPIFVGSGAQTYRDLVTQTAGPTAAGGTDGDLPSTEYLCRIAPRLQPLPDEKISSLEPFYIRASEAELKRLKPIDPHA